MLLHVARAAYALAALAALAAAIRHREHRELAAVLTLAAALVLLRAAGPPADVDALALLALPALAATAAPRLLAGVRRRRAGAAGLVVLLLGIVTLEAGAGARGAFRVAHVAAAAVELWALGRWVAARRRGGRATTPEAVALVLAAGDVALALAAPLVAWCGWPAAQLQAIAIMGIVATLEGLDARRVPR